MQGENRVAVFSPLANPSHRYPIHAGNVCFENSRNLLIYWLNDTETDHKGELTFYVQGYGNISYKFTGFDNHEQLNEQTYDKWCTCVENSPSVSGIMAYLRYATQDPTLDVEYGVKLVYYNFVRLNEKHELVRGIYIPEEERRIDTARTIPNE